MVLAGPRWPHGIAGSSARHRPTSLRRDHDRRFDVSSSAVVRPARRRRPLRRPRPVRRPRRARARRGRVLVLGMYPLEDPHTAGRCHGRRPPGTGRRRGGHWPDRRRRGVRPARLHDEQLERCRPVPWLDRRGHRVRAGRRAAGRGANVEVDLVGGGDALAAAHGGGARDGTPAAIPPIPGLRRAGTLGQPSVTSAKDLPVGSWSWAAAPSARRWPRRIAASVARR